MSSKLITVFEIELPHSKSIIKFRHPRYEDKSEVYKVYNKEDGVPAEDFMAVLCILAIDGTSVSPNVHPNTLIGQMLLDDWFYYFGIWSELCLETIEKREQRRDIAKKLLNGESVIGTQKK